MKRVLSRGPPDRDREVENRRTHRFRSRRFITSWAPSTIFSAVRPYFRRSSSASPLSPNTSWTPTMAIGAGWFAAITEAIAAPMPWTTECSSAVTIPPVSRAARSIVALSSCLAVERLIIRPCRPGGQPGVRPVALPVEFRVRLVRGVPVDRARAPDHVEPARHGNLPGRGEARRDADHVRLRDPELEETVRE